MIKREATALGSLVQNQEISMVPCGRYTATGASPFRGGIKNKALETHGVGL